MIDVSDETTRTLGHAFAEALAKVEAADYLERRRLAATSDDQKILIVLSETASDDRDVVRMLLENSHTPPIALKKIVEHKTAGMCETSSGKLGREDLEVTEDENAILDAMKHRNADDNLLTLLSKDSSWHIRYGVAMQTQASQEILEELTRDSNLAIRAMASKRLGLPVVDENLGVQTSCSDLNRTFEKVRKTLFSNRKLTDTLMKQLAMTDETYGFADQFFRDCVEAVEELRTRVVHRYVAVVKKKNLPNLDLSSYEDKFPKVMGAFDKAYFDAYLIAAKLKELTEKRTTLSLSELREQARKLLPYVTDPTADYSDRHGPASKPEHILDGKRLKLRAYIRLIGDYSTIDYEIVNQVEGLEQLSTVVLKNADPATVTSHISTILLSRQGPRQIYQKILIGSSITAVRFYKNGTFLAEYASVEDAEKVAKALVSRPQPCPP